MPQPEELDDEGFVRFEPVKFLNAPTVAFTNLIESDDKFESVLRTFASPESLTPKERNGYVQRLKKAAGAEDGVGGMAIDIATNPFVWLLALTSPAMVKSADARLVGKGGLPKGWLGSFMKLYQGALSFMQMTGGLQEGSGTGVQAGLVGINKVLRKHHELEHTMVGKARVAFMKMVEKETGRPVQSLVWDENSDPVVRDYIARYSRNAAVFEGGLDKPRGATMPVSKIMETQRIRVLTPEGKVEVRRAGPGEMKELLELQDQVAAWNVHTGRGMEAKQPTWKGEKVVAVDAPTKKEMELQAQESWKRRKKNKDPRIPESEMPFQVFKHEEDLPWLTEGKAEEFLRSLPKEAMDLIEARQNHFREAKKILFLDGKGEVDPSKVYKLWQHLVDVKGRPKDYQSWAADSLSDVSMFVSESVRQQVTSGGIPREKFLEIIKDSVGNSLSTSSYLPRNTKTVYGGDALSLERKHFDTWKEQERKNPRNFTSLIQESNRHTLYDPEDIEALVQQHGLTQGLADMRKRIADVREAKIRKRDFTLVFDALDPERAHRTYSKHLKATDALVVDPLSEMELAELAAMKRPRDVTRDVAHRAPLKGEVLDTSVSLNLANMTQEVPEGGWSRSDFFKSQYAGMEQKGAAYWEDVLLPRVLGQRKIAHMTTWHMQKWAHEQGAALARTPLMKWGGQQAPWFEQMRKNMEQWGDTIPTLQSSSELGANVAGYAYSVYLTNPMTVMGNALQPLTAAATIGYPAVFEGYGKAIKQVGAYIKERVKHPIRMEPAAHQALIKKAFPYAEEWGLLEDVVSAESLAVSTPYKEAGKFKFWSQVFPLKFFGLSDRFNKVATGEAMLSFHARNSKRLGGPALSPERVQLDAVRAISDFQFMSSPEGMPQIFGGTSDPHGFLGRFLHNPFFRMFMSFPMRSMTNWLVGSQQYGGGVREFGFQKFGGPSVTQVPAVLGDMMRMLGGAAIVYEGGKNLAGADLSKWLGPDAAASGLNPMTYVSTPPFTLPRDVLLNVREGEWGGLVRDVVPQLFPGGLMFQKMLGVMPEMGVPVQKTYADWKARRSDGTVPVFKADGSLLSFENPVALVMKGIGADFGMWKDEQELTTFLAKNAQQIKEYRRQHVRARLANDFHAAGQIEAEFKGRFGFPLVTSSSQLQAAINSRMQTQTQRMVNSFPADVRPHFKQFVPESVSGEGEVAQESMGARTDAGQRTKPAFSSFSSFQ